MKYTIIFILSLTIQIFSTLYMSPAHAFGCTSNGVSIGGAGTFTIPVTVTLSKSTSQLTLTDMSSYTSCTGDSGTEYQDALRVTGSSLSSALTSVGYSGFFTTSGIKYNFPGNGACIWPDSSCTIYSVQNTGQVNRPVKVTIGMQRVSMNTGMGVTIPAGAEIARLSVDQRSRGAWGWGKTWIFTTRNTIVIPAYTCQISNPDQTVVLPAVKATDMRNSGAGKYPVTQNFKMQLNCDPHTTVAMRFDGTTMQGYTNVLANNSAGNDAVGIQVLYKNLPIVMGTTTQVIADSQTQETLSFDAAYYYNGNALKAGPVTSVATVTFSYN